MALISGLSGSTSIDPNSQAGADQATLNEDLNQFLNLLVTQLQHQDPLDPMDANEFTSQLVQFAGVEQQIYANANLEKLVGLQEASQVSFMVDYLGTTVEAVGDTFTLENGKAEFTYALGLKSHETIVTITDETGRTVYSVDGETDAGKHTFNWNGTDSSGLPVDDGTYSVTVSAVSPTGELIDVAHTVFGRVTGAGADAGEVALFLGDVAVPMEAVISVNETPSGGI